MPYTPDGSGYRLTDTSLEAIPPNAGTLRAAALVVLQGCPMNADEVADALGESVLAIRPRVTELRNDGFVFDSGERRPMHSGKDGIVWTTVRPLADVVYRPGLFSDEELDACRRVNGGTGETR